jgi:hypothetical protein
VRKVVLTYLIVVIAALFPCLAKCSDTISQNKGLELYSSYYQKNAGQVEVYYDSIEDGKLVGGKVLLALPPVLEYQSDVQAPLAPPLWSYQTIIYSGPSENRIDIVVVGDGYTQSELNKYQLNVNSILGGYFAQEPLASYINFFNVHRVDVVSNESGVDEPNYDEPNKSIYRDTALDMTYNCAGISRLLCVDTAKALNAASVAPDADQILALANSTRYGGAGYIDSNIATMAGNNSYSVELALHEFGHSFGKLADEYEYGQGETYTGPEPSSINISIYNAQQQTNLQTKWYRWLDLPNVYTYEGAFYYKHGIYRPTSNSKMRSLNRPFEEVNVEQIIFRIYENVSIIDDSTPLSEEPVSCYTNFYVIPVEPTPNTISIQWRIDGQLVSDANAFSPDISTLTVGLHEISVRVTDNTSMVRDEIKRAQLMTKSLQWQIDVPKYSGGTGEPNNPYQIANAADLRKLANDANDYNKCFILTADIDLDPNLPGNRVFTTAVIASDNDYYSVNHTFEGTSFTGSFDGSGHKIKNLTIDTNGVPEDYLGLFGRIEGGLIKNLSLENIYVACVFTQEPWFMGGLVGYNSNGTILNCRASGQVNGAGWSFCLGVLAGFSTGSIINCQAEGTVTGQDEAEHMGMLAGNASGTISGCYAAGTIIGYVNVGGLVGYSTANISNCASSVIVGGPAWRLGGLVGFNADTGIIRNCYSTGAVNGYQYVGGLVGYSNGSIISCYFLDTAGPNNGYGTPLTDSQMKQRSSFAGWDFVGETANGYYDIWRLCNEGLEYPKMAWRYLPGDIACPDGVEIYDIAALCEQWLIEEIPADLAPPPSGNGIVDFADFAVFAGQWGITNGVNELLDFTGQWLKTGLLVCSADISSDGRVNFADFALIANNWLQGF